MPRTKGALQVKPKKQQRKYADRTDKYKSDQVKYRKTYNRIVAA
jgi:hypothetical protein